MSDNSKIICITGGKGGTGKTLVAVNLAIMFKNEGKNVLLIDGDVDNPNTYLLLGRKLENNKPVYFFKPKIIEEFCYKCGLCAENCATHALLHVKDAYPIPILTVCSGCKLCYKICPQKAIEEDFKIIGWTYYSTDNNLSLMVGELVPSEARSAAIIENLLERLDDIINKFDIIILDTAPGAHCDVELLINKSDLIIPVTEPTKFGKLDLFRIIELIKLLEKDYRVIINRSSLLGFRELFLKELDENKINILGDIPLDDDIVLSYCQGMPLMDEKNDFNRENEGYKSFQNIFRNLLEWLNNKEVSIEN